MAKRRRRRNPTAVVDDTLAPTIERANHEPVERLNAQIADHQGYIARPYRVVGVLHTMERRGSITPTMRLAGEQFRDTFRLAQLDPLQASDYARPMVSGKRVDEPPSTKAEKARVKTWRAIVAVGGLTSPGGSCVWHVLGWEQSIKEWAAQQALGGRALNPHLASGVLVTCLGVLEWHYGLRGPKYPLDNVHFSRSNEVCCEKRH
jgi:hypothetical protein